MTIEEVHQMFVEASRDRTKTTIGYWVGYESSGRWAEWLADAINIKLEKYNLVFDCKSYLSSNYRKLINLRARHEIADVAIEICKLYLTKQDQELKND